MWDSTGQCTLLARCMLEVDNRERRTPKRQCMLNTCDHQGREGGGGYLTWQRTPKTRSQGPEGGSQTQQQAPLARGHRVEEEGGPPNHQRAQPAYGQERVGANPTMQRATPLLSQGGGRRGTSPNCSMRTSRAGRGERGPTRPGSTLPRVHIGKGEGGNPPQTSACTPCTQHEGEE